MKYFENDFLVFFKELSENNNSIWFKENRTRYEKNVKEPFFNFVGYILTRIREYEPDIVISPADAIFRIHRDIRFSKDKTPYKTCVSAVISKYGRKDKTYPGIYFEFCFEKIMFYGGAYMVEAPILQNIRKNIAANLKEFQKIYMDSFFKNLFGQIQGEKAKRIPDEFKQIADKEPLIYNKQFYYAAKLDAGLIFKEELVDTILQHYIAGRELNIFLQNAY